MTRGSPRSSSPTRSHRTNITEQPNTFTTSRGHLVSSFLTSPLSPSLEDDARRIAPPDARYAGFNLLLLAAASAPHASFSFSFDALFVTNRGGGGAITFRAPTAAERHRGGLSNGVDGDGADEWPKVQHGVRALDALLDALPPDIPEDQLTERLFDLLTWVYDIRTLMRAQTIRLTFARVCRWRSPQPPRDRSELRNTIQVEPLHDANGYYGTRLATVVLVKRSGEVVFTERDRWGLTAQGQPILADPSSQRVFRFKMERSE